VAHNTSIGDRVPAGRFVLAATLLLLMPVLALAQTVSLVHSGQTFELRYTATFSPDELTFGQMLGYDTVQLGDGEYLTEPGRPMLPAPLVRIALPAGMTVTNLRVLDTESVELPGQYLLFPAQPPRPTSDPADAADFVPPDAATYSSATPYPAESATFIQECDLAGQALAVVQLCPLHYVPQERKLSLFTSLTIVLEGVSGYVCGDYLPAQVSAAGYDFYERSLTSLVVNPDDVALTTAGGPAPGQRGVAAGDYDYVIITSNSWVSAFQPLADWKTKKGVPANIVTTDWIYSTYTGSTNVDKIRAFVIDAYNTWGTTFFLIGGDTGTVPCKMTTFSSVDSDPVPNDTYYADFDADWVIEVNVGRASVTGTGSGAGGIAAFISKIMTFEKNPPMTSYAKKAGFFGFDLDSSTHAEQCKIQIDNSYVPATWTMTNVYDSQGGNHYTNVIAAINAGQMLLNHADHSASDFMGTGYINHGWGLDNGDMDALNNGSRQSILYSMGCDPCAFDSSQCIAEHFVRNTGGGGVAFIGNSRYGWYSTASYNTLSMGYDQKFFYSLLTQNNYKLGAAFSGHKNDYAPGSDQYRRYIWTELTLLGDPELPVWTDDIQTLTATFPTSVPLGPSSFSVHVSSGSNPVNQAYVCLWKGTEVYLTGQTNSAGDVTFTPSPSTTGTLYVTVTKQNYLPYEGAADVVQATNYTLTVNTNGQGTVTLDPPGGTYPSGTSVQLTANAATGWHFDHWSGDLSGSTNPATLVMDGNKTVTAWFVQDQYTLTVNINGQGTVALDPPGGTYLSGTSVQLTANAATGWHFDHWSGDLSGSTNPATLVMDGNKTVTAWFVQDQYTLTVNINGQGTVMLNPPGGVYLSGTLVQLTANAATDWHFDHWSGDLSGSTNPATLVMDGNKTVTAVFGRIGDLNCDGSTDFNDINPFVMVLSDPALWQQTYPGCLLLNGDINGDGTAGFADINPFVSLLTSQ
jgi:hypothetical protein